MRGPGLPRPFDVALAVVVALAEFVPVALIASHTDERGPFGLAGWVLLGLGAGALVFRRQYPSGVLAVTLVSTVAYWSLGYARGPVFFALIVALINAVLAGRRRAAIAALIVGFVCNSWLGSLIGRADAPEWPELLGLAAWLVALISLGEAWRYRRDRAEEAARSEAEALRRQATEERLRIARELHDVVAHNMSLISIQSGVALHLIDTNPDQARESLAAIKDASKEALVELRSLLGVLRLADETGPDQEAPRAPVPSLERLDDLVDRARAAGLDVQVEVSDELGSLASLPRQVDLAAFRIVQESLTNVARHSDRPAAVVRLVGRDGGLAVDVLDEGSGRSPGRGDLPAGAGTGLTGMRERATSIGGRFEAGPRPGRGFAVRAWLPLATTPEEDPT